MTWRDIAAALTMAVASTAATPPADETADALAVGDVPPPGAAEIVQMEDERYRRMTVPVTIMGEGPFRFMIDTGAEATVLSHTLADRLQLAGRKAATLVGMASSRPVETTRLPEISFGSRSRINALAVLVEGRNIGGADGILGLDSLQDSRVLLDFVDRRIHVANARDLGGNDGYDIVVRARRAGNQLIITRARLDRVRTAIVVDTGAQGSVGNAALARRLRRARQSGEAEMTDINGVQVAGLLRTVRSLDIGRARLADFEITFADSPLFAALELEDEPALVLGMNALRAFERVAIDFPTRRVLFDLPASAGMPPPERFGRLGG